MSLRGLLDSVLCGDVWQSLVRIICSWGLVVGVQECHHVPLAPLAQVAEQADYEQRDYDDDDYYDSDDQTCAAILFVRHCVVFCVKFLQCNHLFNLTGRAFSVMLDHSERCDSLSGLVD